MEATDQSEPFGMSISEAAAALQSKREARANPPKEDPKPEPEDQAEPEQAEAEPEPEAEEVLEDQPEAEETEEAEPEAEEDGEDLYEVNGEYFTFAELQEWKAGNLRQADYTRKTQELSRDREVFAQEREQFTAEREQAQQAIQQQQAQLKDALATFAIQQSEPPKRADYPTTDAYLDAKDTFDADQAKKAQAEQAYTALVQQERQQKQAVEAQKAIARIPELGTDEGTRAKLSQMEAAVSDLGISSEQILAAGLDNHLVFLVLNKLAEAQAMAGDRDAARKAAAKKVVKTPKRLNPSAKQQDSRGDLELRDARKALRKSGSIKDAVALRRAKRKG